MSIISPAKNLGRRELRRFMDIIYRQPREKTLGAVIRDYETRLAAETAGDNERRGDPPEARGETRARRVGVTKCDVCEHVYATAGQHFKSNRHCKAARSAGEWCGLLCATRKPGERTKQRPDPAKAATCTAASAVNHVIGVVVCRYCGGMRATTEPQPMYKKRGRPAGPRRKMGAPKKVKLDDSASGERRRRRRRKRRRRRRRNRK